MTGVRHSNDRTVTRDLPNTAAAPLRGLSGDAGRLRPQLSVRRVGQEGRDALTTHLLGLPDADRCTRFCGQSSDAAIRQHCATLDLADTICFAAVDGQGAVVGAAFGFDCGGGAGQAGSLIEVAVSVDPDHRRFGVGTNLVACVFAVAAAFGATGAAFEFHPLNVAIRGVIRRLGGRIAPFAEDCVIALAAVSRLPSSWQDWSEPPAGRWGHLPSQSNDGALQLAAAA